VRHRSDYPIKPRLGTRRYFAYVRVSTQEQTDLSLDAQGEAIKQYAARRDLEVVRVYQDVESAKAAGLRPQFTSMLADLRKEPEITGVISHKVDRLLRNFAEFAVVDEYIEAGVDFQFVTGSYDRSPVGKLSFGVQVLFAKHYIDNLSEEVKKGLHQRVLGQRRWAFPPPLGYRYQGVEREAEIVPDEERFALVKKAWELLASGQYSLRELAGQLNKLGLRTRGNRRYPKGQTLRPSALYAVLTNPFYYGMMRFNDQLVPGIHTPMISKAIFDRCQTLLRNRGNPRPALKEFTYRGFVICGECGCTVTAEEHTKVLRRSGQRARYVYYQCSKAKGPCGQRTIRHDVLESQLAAALAALEPEPETVEGLRRALHESFDHEQEYRRTTLEALRRRQDEIEKRKDVLIERYLDDRIPEEEYQRKYQAYREELFTVNAEIQRLADAREQHVEEIELLLKLGSRLASLYENSDPSRKRAIVKLVASNCVLKDGKARLNPIPAFEVLLKAGMRPEWWALVDSNHGPHPYQGCALTT
jgi:site-specific DNA recombinase